MIKTNTNLPLVLAGPIVRHVTHNTFTVWLVTSTALCGEICVFQTDAPNKSSQKKQHKTTQHTIAVGSHCFIHCLILKQTNLFEHSQVYEYDIKLSEYEANNKHKTTHSNHHYLSDLLPELLYEGQQRFSIKYSQTLQQLVHGSCRKAHFRGDDALPQLDSLIEDSFQENNQGKKTQRPDLVLFTGDQVYIDDVAGPTLCAIKQVVKLLGLYHEEFEGSTVKSSQELDTHKDTYYRREQLLPETKSNKDLTDTFFKAKRKPIFTSVDAKNHLIALNEMIAIYLLSWSSRLWPLIDTKVKVVDEEFQATYEQEQIAIDNFVSGLPKVERSFAHIPVYMIFDDHDVTDDWNLTRAWEEEVYENPFSKRIVGNALIAYLLCQGIGNPETTWLALQDVIKRTFTHSGIKEHDACVDAVLTHHNWHYGLDTHPPIQVLDTRTQRWRSESNANKPSGLMDWEALCNLQHELIDKESVIVVSPAPVYGVKFIESIQRIFTTFGGALIVDAENWMAHRGTANVMLNIFRHKNTPPHFIILSGDVHYSFVYDVSIRFRKNSPNITQFTCSGIHNQFPNKLIMWFERLNRWLYGRRSPLNVLTKRRNMSIKERENDKNHLDLYNATSLGLLEIDAKGHEKSCKLVLSNGDIVTFNK